LGSLDFQGFPLFLFVYSLYTLADSLQSLCYEVIGFFFRQWIKDMMLSNGTPLAFRLLAKVLRILCVDFVAKP